MEIKKVKSEIDKYKKVAVIYASDNDRVSISGMKPTRNRCSLQIDVGGHDPVIPVVSAINALISIGIVDYYVVIGLGKNSVKQTCNKLVEKYKNKIKITYVEDNLASQESGITFGLNAALKSDPNEIYLMSGDTIIYSDFLRRLEDVPRAACLVRQIQTAKLNRSIYAYCEQDILVTGFWSNFIDMSKEKDHLINETPDLPKELQKMVCYESMGVFKIIPNKDLINIVEAGYNSLIKENKKPENDGMDLMSYIASIEEFFPVFINQFAGYFSIKTDKDIDLFKKYNNAEQIESIDKESAKRVENENSIETNIEVNAEPNININQDS